MQDAWSLLLCSSAAGHLRAGAIKHLLSLSSCVDQARQLQGAGWPGSKVSAPGATSVATGMLGRSSVLARKPGSFAQLRTASVSMLPSCARRDAACPSSLGWAHPQVQIWGAGLPAARLHRGLHRAYAVEASPVEGDGTGEESGTDIEPETDSTQSTGIAPESAAERQPRKFAPAYLDTNRKKWREADPELLTKEHTIGEAIAIIQQHASAKFPESVDVVMKLGVDPRRADQGVRGMASLPHNPGREVRLAVFAEEENLTGVKEAGATYAGGEELIADILSGAVPLDFNRCIATPTIMAALGDKLGRMLGPKKLMPNVKLGTVSTDLVGTIEAMQRGQAGFRVDKGANVHASIGRVNMGVDQLAENTMAFIGAVVDAQPKAKSVPPPFSSTPFGPAACAAWPLYL
jgi:large subunit ribosomal protein L1